MTPNMSSGWCLDEVYDHKEMKLVWTHDSIAKVNKWEVFLKEKSMMLTNSAADSQDINKKTVQH